MCFGGGSKTVDQGNGPNVQQAPAGEALRPSSDPRYPKQTAVKQNATQITGDS